MFLSPVGGRLCACLLPYTESKATMNAHGTPPADARPDRLLTTLEQLLAIDAIQVKPALQQAAQLISEALYAEKVDAFVYEPATHSLLALGSNDSPMSRHQKALALDRLPLANGGRMVNVFSTGISFLSAHLDQDPEELRGMRIPEPEGMGILSLIAASIEMQGERRGVLMAACGMHDFFTQQDLQFLEATARWVGMVIHRAELVEQHTREAVEQGRRLAAEELLTIMAHDLKNYLTPLKARLDLLKRRAQRLERREDLRDVQIAIATLTRLDRLISSLLDIARIDQGLFVLQVQPLNLMDLLSETIPSFATTETQIQIEGPEEVLLWADPDRLRQLIENLLANAVKHAQKHTPILAHVESEQHEDGVWVLLSVHNQGPTIPEDLLAHLFQPFVAGSSSQGLGLGLYLGRRIAQAHQGQLTVVSEETRGTQFTLSLPMEQERTGNTGPLVPPQER